MKRGVEKEVGQLITENVNKEKCFKNGTVRKKTVEYGMNIARTCVEVECNNGY